MKYAIKICFMFLLVQMIMNSNGLEIVRGQDTLKPEAPTSSASPAGQTDDSSVVSQKKKEIDESWQQALIKHTQKGYSAFLNKFKMEELASNERGKAQKLIENLKPEQQQTTFFSTDIAASRFIDCGDGTIMDRQSGLMWTKADSYADLGKCLTFGEAYHYVRNLKTGGYSDWQVPSLQDMQTLYSDRFFSSAFDRKPVHVPSVFQEGSAWWFWTRTEIETGNPKVKDFIHGDVGQMDINYCDGGGIRAIRFTTPFFYVP